MDEGHQVPSGPFYAACALAATMAIFTLWVAVRPLTEPPNENRRDPSIRLTAFNAVLAWCIGGAFGVWTQRTRARHPRWWLKCGRWVYTWAWALSVLHIAVAFHVGHAWSHDNAYRHIEALSGFGPGIFVNYTFVAVWLVDVVWAWVAFDSYLSRLRWIGWLLVAFMAFIVFNAAVVFGNGILRIVSGLFFVLPMVLLWETRPWATRANEMAEPGRRPGSGGVSQSRADHSPT